MQPMKPPRQEEDYGGRDADCRDAVESKVFQLMEEAVHVGWRREEVLLALAAITADAQALLEEGKG